MTPVIKPVVVRVGNQPGTGGSGPDSKRLAMTSCWEHESLALGATTTFASTARLCSSRAYRLFDG
jgi:hypothetical protein